MPLVARVVSGELVGDWPVFALLPRLSFLKEPMKGFVSGKRGCCFALRIGIDSLSIWCFALDFPEK